MMERTSEKLAARAKAVHILKKLPVFKGLLEDEYFKVLSMCSSKSLPKGETLFKQGDYGASMFILLSGEVDINVEGVGTVHVMQAGEILGEISLVSRIPRTASAVTRSDCVLLQLYAEILHDLVGKYPRMGYVIMRNIAAILAERVVQKNQN